MESDFAEKLRKEKEEKEKIIFEFMKEYGRSPDRVAEAMKEFKTASNELSTLSAKIDEEEVDVEFGYSYTGRPYAIVHFSLNKEWNDVEVGKHIELVKTIFKRLKEKG